MRATARNAILIAPLLVAGCLSGFPWSSHGAPGWELRVASSPEDYRVVAKGDAFESHLGHALQSPFHRVQATYAGTLPVGNHTVEVTAPTEASIEWDVKEGSAKASAPDCPQTYDAPATVSGESLCVLGLEVVRAEALRVYLHVTVRSADMPADVMLRGVRGAT